jgi:hypothetical protein
MTNQSLREIYAAEYAEEACIIAVCRMAHFAETKKLR